MIGLPLHQRHSHQRASDHRLRFLPTEGRWSQAEPTGLKKSLVMTTIGVGISSAGVLLALALGPDVITVPLLLGGSLICFGAVMLLCASGEKLIHRISRIKKHCGCCRFYQAQPGQYARGICQLDPRAHTVQRGDACPSFHHSERAMVRDRLSQRPDLLKGIQITRTGDTANRA